MKDSHGRLVEEGFSKSAERFIGNMLEIADGPALFRIGNATPPGEKVDKHLKAAYKHKLVSKTLRFFSFDRDEKNGISPLSESFELLKPTLSKLKSQYK